MIYLQHKEKKDLVCETNLKELRFFKWVWVGDKCTCVWNVKDIDNFNVLNKFNIVNRGVYEYYWFNQMTKA